MSAVHKKQGILTLELQCAARKVLMRAMSRPQGELKSAVSNWMQAHADLRRRYLAMAP